MICTVTFVRCWSSGRGRSRIASSRTAITSWARGDNVTKTGARYDNDYCLVFRLESGKIKEVREYCDSILTEQALGRFPEPRRRAAG